MRARARVGGVDGDDGERAVRLDDDDVGVGASVAGERAVVRVDDGVAVWGRVRKRVAADGMSIRGDCGE